MELSRYIKAVLLASGDVGDVDFDLGISVANGLAYVSSDSQNRVRFTVTTAPKPNN